MAQMKIFMCFRNFFGAMALMFVFVSQNLAADTNVVARGKYLVENVAGCAECHTERDWKGTLNRDKWLRGATLGFGPTRFMPWAAVAPDIAGLPMFKTDAEAIIFFQSGTNALGKTPNPPMTTTELTREDAEAVVAYLRSLKSVEK
jgi:mono/diheme cytochrome c family protein